VTLRVSVSALLALTVALGGCVSSGDPGAAPPAASQNGAPASAGASGAPGQASTSPTGKPVVVGSATDKEACTRVATKLGEWGQAFANAAAGLAQAGSDTGKVQTVVNGVKAANTKFAGDLRAEASKTKDEAVKKVTSDLAAAMDSVNSQLDAAKIAKDPDSLTAAFDQPAYAAAAEAYEKVCAG
jgi:acetylornithine deacetylase/succinyl-diaminopimelate desuccinylase-like protein